MAKIEVIQNYIGGEWVRSHAKEYLDVENPGTGERLKMVPLSTVRDVDKAAKAAKEAFREWRNVPILERQQCLFKMKRALGDHLEELARLITLEHGKVLSEARGEMMRAIENIDYAVSAPALMQGRVMLNAGRDVDVEMHRFPEGVFAIICPFNFPAMIPFWFLPQAVVMGNTVVVKPSEQVPLTMQRIFELMESVGLPKGVVNLVNGDRIVVDALLEHPDIRGVASVSSTPTMRAISRKAVEHGKKFLCQGGAKNFIVVMPDADLDRHLPNILGSVYGNTGQRCLAGSNVVGVGDIRARLKMRVVEATRVLRVGYGLDDGSQMGPLISEGARARVVGYIEKGLKEKGNLAVDGRTLASSSYPKGHYLGPLVFQDVDPNSTIAREEIFGPVLIHLDAKNLEEAISWINASPYGNAASIYTRDLEAARKFTIEVEAGNIGVNIGVPAPIAFFPFAGMKESFMGVLHGQADEALRFFTDIKVVTKRA